MLILTAGVMGFGVMGFGGMGSAFAECGKGKPIFEDAFETLDRSWGAPDDQVSVEKGSLVVKPKAGYSRWVLSQSDFYGDGSLCVDIKLAESSDVGSTNLGAIFWAVDYANFYALYIGTDGKQGFFKVTRLSKGRWLTPVDWTPDPAIKFKLGETNSIEVQTKGRIVTAFVNGKQLAQLNGSPPEGGGLIGVFGGSPEGTPAKLVFQKLQFFPPAGFHP
jgi:hypothetical protein